MVPEDKKRVTVTLSREVAAEFEKVAKDLGWSKSALLTFWINEKRKA